MKGILLYHKKSLKDIIMSDNGYLLSDNEAKTYLQWCDKQGYKTLYDCPDFEQVKEKIFK